jgi:hypothetical protein
VKPCTFLCTMKHEMYFSSKITLCRVNISVYSLNRTSVTLLSATSQPCAERSKAWVCGSFYSGIWGSNPITGWMPVSCECCVLAGMSLRRFGPSSKGVLLSIYVSLSVIKCNSNTLHLQRVGRKRSD